MGGTGQLRAAKQGVTLQLDAHRLHRLEVLPDGPGGVSKPASRSLRCSIQSSTRARKQTITCARTRGSVQWYIGRTSKVVFSVRKARGCSLGSPELLASAL